MVRASKSQVWREIERSVRRFAGVPDSNRDGIKPRKIAHLLRKYDPAAWGGTESAVLELLLGLREHGVDSVVFAPFPFRGPTSKGWPSDDREDPIAAAGFTVRRFSAFLPTFGISPVDRERSMAVGGNIMSLSAPLMLLQEPGIDVIHSHALGRIGAIARIVANARQIPYVVSIHGGFLDLPDRVRESLSLPIRGGLEWGRVFGWAFGARRVVDDAHAVVTCNPREAMLLSQKLPEKRISLLPHGIRVGRFQVDCRHVALSRWPQLALRRVILCVGRIDAIKNQLFVVRALSRIVERFPDVVLVCAGVETDPIHAGEMRRVIAEERLENHVVWTGNLGPRDVALVGLYQHAEFLVLPSLSETFGLVILEAWAAGKTVVVSDTSGARQIVRHDENGAFFDVGDPESFVQQVSRLLVQPELAQQWGQAGKQEAERQYASCVVAKRFLDLYRQTWEGFDR